MNEEKIIKTLKEFCEDLLSLIKHHGGLDSEVGNGVRVISVVDRWKEVYEECDLHSYE